MLDPQGETLADELRRLMERGAAHHLDDSAFDDIARRVFAYNFERVRPYAAYAGARGMDPASVAHWTEIPAVPTAAFKDLTLLARGATAEAVFRTSGTTRGPERRGEHHVADLSLYRASLRPTFATFVLPDRVQLPVFSLVPAAAEMPDSSLAFMVQDVMAHFGAGGGSYASLDGLDLPGLEYALAEATANDSPVLLLGTSAAFIHWLDALTAANRRHALPEGSRLMDTGGFKGGGRQVAADELRSGYERRLGVPAHRCVNEYGMTEMLSQLYDTILRDHHAGRQRPARKAGSAWTRSVAVDPETLDPLPAGRTGLLRHVDLANLGSVAAIQTEDLGRVDEHGVVLEGRAVGATPRGCSIAMDLLLRGGP
jgi:hypothetical protein